jgi:ectoine hydroxylase-related dioxygenase (phytanoyl-CoA dioxygenase family)
MSPHDPARGSPDEDSREGSDLRAALAGDGFALAGALIEDDLVRRLIGACPEIPGAGVRDLLRAAPEFRRAVEAPRVRAIVGGVLGRPGLLTRAILFDKAPGANWALGFHQDVVIAVAERIEAPGFGPWSIKAGIHHVRPPAAVLEGMLTVRIHLDDCGPENGPLEVIPGSHAHGFL